MKSQKSQIEFYLIPGKLGFCVNRVINDSKIERNPNSSCSIFAESRIFCFSNNNKEIKILNSQKEVKKINSAIELYLNQVIF
jgi:hypothetical protein